MSNQEEIDSQTFDFDHLKNNQEKIATQVEELWKDEKLFDAHSLLTKLESSIENQKENKNELPPLDPSHDRIFKRVRVEYKDAQSVLKVLKSDDGWSEPHCTKDGIKVFYRTRDDFTLRPFPDKDWQKSTTSFRFDCDVDCPMFNVLSIFYEVDLYTSWMYRQEIAEKVEEIGRYKFVCYEMWNAPFPFSNRDIVFYGFGVDLIDQGEGILVVTRSIDPCEYDEFSKNIPPAQKVQRMDCNYSAFLAIPISPTKTHVKVLCSFNFHIPLVPMWTINLVLRYGGPMMMNKMRSLAMNVDDFEYGKRIKENTEIYGDMKKRMERIFNKKKEEKEEEKEEEEGEEEEITKEEEEKKEEVL